MSTDSNTSSISASSSSTTSNSDVPVTFSSTASTAPAAPTSSPTTTSFVDWLNQSSTHVDSNLTAVAQGQEPTPAPLSRTSSWRGASVALGVLSAAKAGLKLAPAFIDGGLNLAHSGTESVIHYTRRGVEVGSDVLRSGVVLAGEAAATKLESLSAEAGDEAQAAKYTRWSENARAASAKIDRGLEKGSDIVERHVLSAVSTVAKGGLTLSSYSLKTSLAGTKALVAAADTGTKYVLRAKGVDVAELEEELEHEKMVDCVLNIIQELQQLNSNLKDVGTTEMISCLMTYARLVETVEQQNMFKNRRPVLPEYLAAITEERKKRQLALEQESKQDPLPPVDSRLPLPSTTTKSTSPSSPSPDPSNPFPWSSPTTTTATTKVKQWFSGWWGASSSAASAAASAKPTPSASSSSDHTTAHSSPSYEDGLIQLAGEGMTKVSRAMLLAGCAYGPRFMKFLGLPTNAKTHELFIIEQAGVKQEDILLADFNSSLKRPGHYLVLDHKFKQVVLVIRGSSALTDGLTDLTCKFSKHVSGTFGTKGYTEGSAHEGMLKSAQWFAQHLKQDILKALKSHPDYGFTVTGHSLGAGVGSLLTLLWLHDPEMNPPTRRIQAYFFGSPCVVSAELAHLGYGYVLNFVLGHDVVCRLSKGAVEDLTEVVLNLTSQSREETMLFKLPSKERKLRRAELDELKREAEAKGRPRLHPACTDHKQLSQLLDRYHELVQTKKDQDAALAAEEEKTSPSEAPSTASALSSLVSPKSISEELNTLLQDLTMILLHQRKSMTHEKLYPLGHIFHLLPREESPNKEDQLEKKEADRLQQEVEHPLTSIAESSSTVTASSTPSTSTSSSDFWSAKKKPVATNPRTRVVSLHEMIGADVKELEARARMIAIENENDAATAESVAMETVASTPAALASSSSSVNSSPTLGPIAHPRPALPIALPVARTVHPDKKRKSVPTPSPPVATPQKSSPSLPVAAPVSSASQQTTSNTEFVEMNEMDLESTNVTTENRQPDVAMENEEKEDKIDKSGAPLDISASSTPTILPSTAIASTLPIAVAAFQPRLAPPIAKPTPTVAADDPMKVFTHPPPFDIYAGHWSDLTDLILSSQMIKHHLPAAYFIALSTHATTKQQHQQQLNTNSSKDSSQRPPTT